MSCHVRAKHVDLPDRRALRAADLYTLHVWAVKENPTGTFSNWHSKVSSDSFSPLN
jgi:hypothetical protein